MSGAAVITACVVLTLLAGLQGCVAAGAPWGRLVWGGAHRVLPRRLRVGSILAIVLYAAFAAVLLARSGALPGGDTTFVVVATWVLFGYFCVGIVLNLASRSVAERWVMVPTCIVLAASTLSLALD